MQQIISLLTVKIDQRINNQIKKILSREALFFDFATLYTQNRYNAENSFKLYMTNNHCLEEMNRHDSLVTAAQ